MFIHDVIKIRLSRAGYLLNYPPHLISDEEMCDAFLPYTYDESDPGAGLSEWSSKVGYFKDMYPLMSMALLHEYQQLVIDIAYHLHQLKTTLDDEYKLPDWVYAYMLGAVVGPYSDIRDRHDLFVLLGTDNLYDEFDEACMRACYRESTAWLDKLSTFERAHRPPTLFGAPHVIKSLRLQALNLQ